MTTTFTLIIFIHLTFVNIPGFSSMQKCQDAANTLNKTYAPAKFDRPLPYACLAK